MMVAVFGILGIFCVLSILCWLVKDVRRSIRPAPEPEKPTKLDQLIETYMKSDPLDVSATIEFLMEAEVLKDPFVEAPRRLDGTPGPPRKPSSATIMDDIANVYAVPSHMFGEAGACRMCGFVGTLGGGVCKLCGHRQYKERFYVTDANGNRLGTYARKQEAVEAGYELQKLHRPDLIAYVFDEQTGKGERVASAPRTIDDIREEHGRKRKHPRRDAKGRFCKAPEPVYASYDAYVKDELERKYASIHPMDEPYPIEMIRPALPGRTIRD